MCNAYIAKPKKGSAGWKARVSDEMEKLNSALIRKSDPGVVVHSGENQLKTGEENPAETMGNPLIPHTMRWGFHRPFNPSINNSRSDRLESAVGKTAFRNRRCLIPVSAYFEWGEGLGGKK